jgi:hypothetical protein
MKNKFLLLLSIILTSLHVESQINYEDSTVQAITYWELNESHVYEITQSKNKSKETVPTDEGAMRSEVRISVIDSTETSYTIEWRFLKHYIPNLDLIPELKDLLDKKRYIYRTNELGEFEELLNWEEVRDNTLATAKVALNSVAKSNNALNDSLSRLVNTFTESLMTKEYVEQKVIEPINMFHSFFGAEYKLGEILESEIEIPIPIPNMQSTKAQVKVWFDSIDEEYDTYTLCYEQKIDQEAAKKLISEFMDNLSKQLSNKNLSDVVNEALREGLDYKITIYSEFDNTGWPLNIIGTTNINLGNNQQNKIIRIRMISD